MIENGQIRRWMPAFLLALCFHAALFTALFFSPDLWHKKVRMPPVYHVQLFEPQAVQHSSPGKTRHKVKPVTKRHTSRKIQHAKVVKKKRPTTRKNIKSAKAKTQEKHVKKTSKKAVSLKPEKAKKKQASKPPARKKTARQKQKNSEENRFSQHLKDIEKRVRENQKEEKRLQERLASIQKKVMSGASQGTSASAGLAAGSGTSNTLKQYAGAIWMKVRKNWHFPEDLLNKKDIEAIVSIRIMADGHIISRQFERRSGFAAFDRSVLKAVNDADPLPPLPPELRPGPVEIGIRFNPSRMK